MTSPVFPTVVPYTPPPSVVPKVRRKMLFFDRAKLLVGLIVLFGFLVSKHHADVPYVTWSGAFQHVLSNSWFLLAIGAVEITRQVHYLISEKVAGYNHFWSFKLFGGWDRFWSRRNPWLRFRLQRIVKTLMVMAVIFWILAATWNVSFLTAINDAPSRIVGIMFGTEQRLPFIFTIMMTLLFSVGQFAAIFWFMSRGGTDILLPEEVDTRFSDVWGQDKVLDKVKENIAMFDKPDEIEAKGGHVPGGILLWGPPGTGKTLIAKAIAGETGKPYVFVDPGAFQNMFMGVGILKVKGLYRKLRKLALRHGGVIVFFDEADVLGSRGSAVAGRQYTSPVVEGYQCMAARAFGYEMHDHHQAAASAAPSDGRPSLLPDKVRIVMGGMGGGGGMGTLQALLTEMSGLEKPRGFMARRIRKFLTMPSKKPPKYRILTIMATNAPDVLDPALLRPGRLDRIFKVDYPTMEGRIRTYEGYFSKVKHVVTPEQVKRLALMSSAASGAVIKDIVNESLIVALREGRDTVTWPDVLAARALKVHGMPDEVHPMALERHAVAIHEAGHAVAMVRLYKRYIIDVATIEPRGNVGGFVSPVPMEEPGFPWRRENENRIIVSLASLAAERHFFRGDNSVGVGGDLGSATGTARWMEGRSAMGDSFTSFTELVAGESSKGDFDQRVERRLQSLYAQALTLVQENELFVLAIAHALEEHKTISGEDIEAIFSGAKGPAVDGGWYHTPEFRFVYDRYHDAAINAHELQGKLEMQLPKPGSLVVVGSDGALHQWGGAAAPDRALPAAPPPIAGNELPAAD